MPARPSTVIRYEEELDQDAIEYIEQRLQSSADPWPTELEPPPTAEDVATMLDADGRFGAAARGVTIRSCDDERKGMGAFATRQITAGQVVGMYWGEQLTAREHSLRHGWRLEQVVRNPTAGEKASLREREVRLAALTSGVPVSHAGVGARNGSAYAFSLFGEDVKAALGSAMLPGRIAYIDCEDPDLSTWCRYVNHAPEGAPSCNCVARCDAINCWVWLEASRDIDVGEELSFDCTSPAPSNHTFLKRPPCLPSQSTRSHRICCVNHRWRGLQVG